MIKYKYARDKVGEIVDIDNIDKGGKLSYFCISCGNELIPKIGTMRQRHFAHKSITVNCSKETYLHKLSKETLYHYLCSCIENKIPFFIKYNRENCLYIKNIICNSCKSQEIYNLFAGLVIWGADNECPDCGCELERYEHVTKCTKCDYYVNYEPDPDQYRDDCEFQFDFSNQLN